MSAADVEGLEGRVRALLAKRGPVTERRLMGTMAFLVDGRMCCSVGPRGLLVRVTPSTRALALARAHVTPMTLGGRTMRGFVRVSFAGVRTARALKVWVDWGLRVEPASRPPRP